MKDLLTQEDLTPVPARPAEAQPSAGAIVALVLGIVLPVAGIIAGHITLSRMKRTGEGGHAFALAGTIIGYVLTFAGLIPFLIIGIVFGAFNAGGLFSGILGGGGPRSPVGIKGLLTSIGALPPLVQVPIIIGIFLVVAAGLILLIEVAPRPGTKFTVIRLIACIAIPGLTFLLLGSVWWAVAVAVVLGGLFFLLDYRSREGKGYVFALFGFLAPAFVLLLIGLIYPTIATLYNSMLSNRGNFIGFDNFVWVFSQPANLVVIRNTIFWVLVVPVFSTAIGLAYAVFIDRSRGEKFFKVLVFMPMAISFVGASIIWRFVYDYRPADRDQIGVLNGLVTLFGGDPVNWLQQVPLNSFLLMVVLIWVQTGFAMVILSAAIKGVPVEQVEAAQLDGTNAWQRFWNVTIPSIRPSLIVVLTTISIASLKVFDIVRTMGTAYPDTGVIANEMVTLLQKFEAGRSSAFAVILFLLVLPIVIFNARQIQKSREIR